MSEHYLKFIEDLKRLSTAINLPVTRKISERIYGPANTKFIGCEIVIEDVPIVLNELHLIPILMQIGKIYQFRIMIDTNDPLSHSGIAYCSFNNAKSCQLAVEILNEFEIMNEQRLKVRKSRENRTLFLGNLHNDKTKYEIFYEITKIGMKGVQDVITYKSRTNPWKHRGFAFITFENHDFAENARNMFRNRLLLFGKHVYVDWGTVLPENDPDNREKVKFCLFLTNVHST